MFCVVDVCVYVCCFVLFVGVLCLFVVVVVVVCCFVVFVFVLFVGVRVVSF